MQIFAVAASWLLLTGTFCCSVVSGTGPSSAHESVYSQLPDPIKCGFHSDIDTLLTSQSVDAADDMDRALLLLACKRGHAAVVNLLLKLRTSVAICDQHKNTLIHISVTSNLATLEAVLGHPSAPSVINLPNDQKQTPLHVVALKGDPQLVPTLVKHKANLQALDADNRTPLHRAILAGRVEIAEALLACGAVINAQDKNHDTPLHLAVQNRHIKMVYMLMNHGADIFARNKLGHTMLHKAASHDSSYIIALLLENVKSHSMAPFNHWFASRTDGIDQRKNAVVNARDNEGCTPLHLSAEQGHCNVAALLLQNYAQINMPNNHKATPLDFALHTLTNHVMVSFLASKGAIIGTTDISKWTLHRAVKKGHFSMVALLLHTGADIESINEEKETPLHIATWTNLPDMVILLLENGADIEAKDKSGYTPLHFAIVNNFIDMVTLLLERGADIEVQDEHGSAPLAFALKKGSWDIAKLLISKVNVHGRYGYGGRTSLMLAIQYEWDDIIYDIIERGAGINAQDKYGKSALHLAVIIRNYPVTKLLVDRKANRLLQDSLGGNIPLHYAFDNPVSPQILACLIQYTSDCSMPNHAGKTPMQMAIDSNAYIDATVLTCMPPHLLPFACRFFHPLKPCTIEPCEPHSINSVNEKSCLDALVEPDKCPICLEIFAKDEVVVRTHCKHMFHENCLINAINNRELCPCCRTNLNAYSESIISYRDKYPASKQQLDESA